MSDLHAYQREPGEAARPGQGQLLVGGPQTDPYRQPFPGLYRLIDEEGLRADVVLCAGDMTDKARQAPAAEAWRLVHAAAQRMQAGLVLGAVGNHDMDSREHDHEENQDPR